MLDYRLGRLKGEFVVVWYEGGRRRRYRLGTRDPAQARAAFREFVRREHADAITPEATVEAMWNLYLADREAADKPITRMRDAWKALAPHFADRRVDELIDGRLVRNYIKTRRAADRGDGTIHTELGYLRAALRRAERSHVILKAPDIVLPPKPRPRSQHLSPTEAKALIAGAGMPHVKLFILLALHTAGRPSSILDLTWDRVDLERRQIQLDNPARDRTAKGRATVPIAQLLMPELALAKSSAVTDHVIEWGGKPVQSIKRGIARAAERAGLKGVTPYILRHTAAVWMAQSGVPMSEIAQFLGHSSTSVTERVYARFSPEHLRRAADSISTVLFGSIGPLDESEKRTK
jgi:integrase